MSKDSNTFFLRNYPDDDALQNPQKYSKALSFSPDIIPLYGASPDQDALVHPNSWRGFTGMPIVGGDVNNVYLRGHGSGGPYLATLRAFPSELILWPQVWSTVDSVNSTPVVISSGNNAGPYASDTHLQFRPPHATGNAFSLVAHVFKHEPGNELKGLYEYEPIPSFDQNFGVDDFVSFLSNDQSFTFYNVIVADPTLNHVSVGTRLRMIGRSPVPVTIRLEWHKGTPVPAGVEVSLVDDRGKINIPRTLFTSLGDLNIVLDPSYDGIVTLNIYSAGDSHFDPYSGLSLQVSKSNQLLGALNVIFDPHSTRNLRFASPSAVQLRGYKDCAQEVCHCPEKKEDCVAIPVTKPAATGWWFRGALSDPNRFPRTSPGGYSPDVQPIGTDLTAPGLWNSLLDPRSDYGREHAISLVGSEDNYVFLRGYSTIADIDVQARLFALTGSPMLHPKEWTTKSIAGQVVHGDGTVNQQSISVANSNQFYLFGKPFSIRVPDQAHYCFIGEVRQKRKCELVFPAWPSDQIEDFRTLQDFANWVVSSPLVCWRNMNWIPGTRKPEDHFLTWQCSTRLVLPESTFPSTFWTIIVECNNEIIPPDSRWALTCDDDSIFPNGVCFGDIPISTDSPAIVGCHFTGAPLDHPPSNLTLTVSWHDRGINIPPPSVKIRFAVTEITTVHPITHLAGGPPTGSDAWPFYVGSSYPYMSNRPNPSPLPSFTAIGLNIWPYPGAPQHVLGEVSFTGKPE